jgi:NADH:ubiquinone oxidoreductase subunit 5 (subunit L)/multisubunit Na+/H+ antiporter MnhA subunit
MVVCFLSLLVMGITTPIFVIIRHWMVLRGEKREKYKDVIISTGIRFVSLIIIVLKASFLISWLVLISKFDYIYHYSKDHNCTDDTTIFILGYIDEYLENAKHYDWYSLIAVFVMTFLEIWTIIFLYYLQRKSESEKKDYREILLKNIDNDDKE